MNLEFAPVLPLPLLAALTALIVGLALWHVWLRSRGSLLRLTSAALLIAALFNPIFRQDEKQPLTDIALLLVDHTDSQKTGNRLAQTDAAAEQLRQRILELGNMEVRVATVTNSPAAGADGTRLFAALGRALSDIPDARYAGAVIISDGEVHDAPDAKGLTQLKGPLHALISGSRKESDRRMVIDHAPEFSLVGQDAKLAFHVEDQGGDGSGIPVSVTVPGQDTITLEVKPGAAAEVSVPITHAGENIISLSAAVRPGELSAANNTAIAQVNGIRDRLRVLLVSGEPNAGERTWRNLLKADAAVDLVHFTILRPAEKQDATPLNELSLIAFPTQELFGDKLNKFDLVIFDRYRRESVLPDPYLANVADYVREGGALLIASGPDLAADDGLGSTPIGDVMAATPTGDITETPFKPRLTGTGEKHPVTQSLKGASTTDPQWGRWFRIIDATPVDGEGETEVLMQGPDDKPLLVLRRVGKGRVAQILSDQTWLWARGYEGGGPAADLLKRIAHWAMKQPELEEERLVAAASGDGIVVDRYGLKDSYAPIPAQSPSGKTQQVPLKEVGPGHFQGRFTPNEAGLYSFADGELVAVAAAGNGDAKEQGNLLATDKILSPAAAATGGGIFWLEDGLPSIGKIAPASAYAGAGYLKLRANGQTRTLAVKEIDLFSTLASLAALLLLFTLMWHREGR
jgi:hypothetical protein